MLCGKFLGGEKDVQVAQTPAVRTMERLRTRICGQLSLKDPF